MHEMKELSENGESGKAEVTFFPDGTWIIVY